MEQRNLISLTAIYWRKRTLRLLFAATLNASLRAWRISNVQALPSHQCSSGSLARGRHRYGACCRDRDQDVPDQLDIPAANPPAGVGIWASAALSVSVQRCSAPPLLLSADRAVQQSTPRTKLICRPAKYQRVLQTLADVRADGLLLFLARVQIQRRLAITGWD